MRSFAGIIGFLVFLAIVWFSGWFGNTVDKALNTCTAVEQALGDECQPPSTNDGRPIRIYDAPIP